MVERITQKYIRRYGHTARYRTWLGKMVHIETENGVWRINGCGYTYAGYPDAWVLPFEEAQRKVAHCGPEKRAAFVLAGERLVVEVDCGDGAVMQTLNVASFEDGGLEWKLRYGSPEAVRYVAAGIVGSYDYLCSDAITMKEATRRLRLLRAARKASRP